MGMVVNNLWPDILSGSKALDTKLLQTIKGLEVLTVHGTELCLFWGQGNPPNHNINVMHLI